MGMWSVSAVMFLFIWVSVSPNLHETVSLYLTHATSLTCLTFDPPIVEIDYTQLTSKGPHNPLGFLLQTAPMNPRKN